MFCCVVNIYQPDAPRAAKVSEGMSQRRTRIWSFCHRITSGENTLPGDVSFPVNSSPTLKHLRSAYSPILIPLVGGFTKSVERGSEKKRGILQLQRTNQISIDKAVLSFYLVVCVVSSPSSSIKYITFVANCITCVPNNQRLIALNLCVTIQ